eukprot:CAMPEP_0201281756 /NCGR_PEP_ID=MMETSP1317-20130820/3976_1 /ASSEMBLY_ACC=CAM_ASM_000770 /TAXON_ID=187299 /ORGANISM="Undescribed Undescribed, Strain Undescribed" /LENGTH=77 /DNA_ID=CAMNT_0047592529 /DNA_START=179 /DNA_END=415 /DNA_ORIENTATION=-
MKEDLENKGRMAEKLNASVRETMELYEAKLEEKNKLLNELERRREDVVKKEEDNRIQLTDIEEKLTVVKNRNAQEKE